MTRRNISNHRQSTRAAREQQSWNRLQHARWGQPEHQELSWPWAVAIAGLTLVVLFAQYGG